MTWAIILILLGLLLFVAEIFIPSGGAMTLLAIVCLVVGVVMIFYAPESEGGGATSGLITIACLLVLVPLVVAVSFHYWPKTRVGKKFFLPGPDPDQTFADMPEFSELEQFRGQIGKSVTELRPSGAVVVMGRRVDAKTEGLYVEANRWVRVVDVHAGQVTVRPLGDEEITRMPDDLMT